MAGFCYYLVFLLDYPLDHLCLVSIASKLAAAAAAAAAATASISFFASPTYYT